MRKVVFNQVHFLMPRGLLSSFWAYTEASPNALSLSCLPSLFSISFYLPITRGNEIFFILPYIISGSNLFLKPFPAIPDRADFSFTDFL